MTIVTTDQFFQTGRPWADVCAYGAVPDNSTPSAAFIQAAVDYMYTTFGGGTVYLPGLFVLEHGIVVKGGVCIVGGGRSVSALQGGGGDFNTVTFDTSCVKGCGLAHLTVNGFQSQAATSNAIQINQNVSVNLFDIGAFYGSAAMYTAGIDGAYENCWFNGSVNSVWSDGANKYTDVIFNANGSFPSYGTAFTQGLGFSGGTSVENMLTNCDFSGNFTKSVSIYTRTTPPYGITIFKGCIFAAPILLSQAYHTGFIGCEVGSPSFTVGTGSASVVGCVATGFTLTLPAGVVKAGNVNIV